MQRSGGQVETGTKKGLTKSGRNLSEKICPICKGKLIHWYGDKYLCLGCRRVVYLSEK